MAPRPNDHDAFMELAGLYVLGAVSPSDRTAFEAHMATCAACAGEVRSFEQVPAALAQSALSIEPPAGVREWLMASIQPPASAGRSSKPTVRRENLLLLGAAASVALAIGLGSYAVRLRDRVADLDARLAQEILRSAASER